MIFVDSAQLFASQFGFDCGICIAQTCGAHVLHNTVFSTQAPFSSIEWRFANTVVDLRNNLVSHNLRDRGGADAQSGNLQNAPATWFYNAAAGDLHLDRSATAATDTGVALASVTVSGDFEGEQRPIGAARDVGADEYVPASIPRGEGTPQSGGAEAAAPTPTLAPPPDDRAAVAADPADADAMSEDVPTAAATTASTPSPARQARQPAPSATPANKQPPPPAATSVAIPPHENASGVAPVDDVPPQPATRALDAPPPERGTPRIWLTVAAAGAATIAAAWILRRTFGRR
jgi:hypothetical protein